MEGRKFKKELELKTSNPMHDLSKEELVEFRCLLNVKIHCVVLDSPFTDAEEMVKFKISKIFLKIQIF